VVQARLYAGRAAPAPLRRHTCAAECGDEPWEDMQVYLRPRGAAWEIVNWRGEVEEDEVPEMPEKFEPAKPQ
jgi:hypothetical protein